MLLDTNIIIYAMRPEHADLRQFIADNNPAVSAVSYVEALGFHRLGPDERLALEEFFAAAVMLPLTQAVLDRAVQLRQARKMSLGDALVAATALVNFRQLITRNVSDFSWVPGLVVIDPLAP
jgi:predicted nucleic acid-binding protein